MSDPACEDATASDEDDAAMRAYVSRLWAEEWDSPDDAVYDGVTRNSLEGRSQ